MGNYERRKKVYRLVFVDPDFDGLEVDVRGLSMETLFTVQGFTRTALITPEGQEAMRHAFEVFSENVVRWNYTENGEPVGTDLETLLGLDVEFVANVISAWLVEVAGVAGPKELSSSGGQPSGVESLPMEPLSESQSS